MNREFLDQARAEARMARARSLVGTDLVNRRSGRVRTITDVRRRVHRGHLQVMLELDDGALEIVAGPHMQRHWRPLAAAMPAARNV